MKLQLKSYDYKGLAENNPYYAMEKRELQAVLGLWLIWGVSGFRKISPDSLFSLEDPLNSIGKE